ncbi:alpha/beta fold hydrolase [Novosphingobium sp. M1R2S20]|uniref:Alpha/beta fold hydrolase n=1 Tax=Novosphingobium rhizovicinum TaxID=3228928 RepID=A0ABV3RFW3_9SPHN
MEPFAIETQDARIVGQRRHGAMRDPLVLVHGFGGSRQDWRPVIEALPPEWPIIIYDQRGFGESTAEAGAPFSHAEDLLAVLRALIVERADLCGVSLGGATVLGAALRAPDRVRRVALVSPMLAAWSWSAEWIELWKAIGRKARAGDMDGARRLWWAHPLFESARLTGHGDELRRAIEAFPGEQWIRDDQRDELPMVEHLHEIAHPTLLLTGAHDLPDFQLMADLITGSVAHLRRIDYQDAGHMLPLEKPGQVARDLTSFLASSG